MEINTTHFTAPGITTTVITIFNTATNTMTVNVITIFNTATATVTTATTLKTVPLSPLRSHD